MITFIIASATLSVLYVLFSAVRNLGRAQAQVEAQIARMEQLRKQTEIMTESRTPDDAVDRLDRGDF